MCKDKLEEYNFNIISKILFFSSMFTGILFIMFRLDNDVWFLLNGGRYVLEQGIPYIEPFTMHCNMNFVMQQWLTGVIFWLVYSKLSAEALILLVCLTFIVMIYTVYRLCMLVSDENFQISVFIAAGTGILISPFMVTRPQIFSSLLLIIEIYCLEMYVQKRKSIYLFLLPVLSLLLINLHASLWLMLFAFMIPYIIESFPFNYKGIYKEKISNKSLLVCSIVMVAVGFCNPYGLDAMTYLFRSYGYEQINNLVSEMRPLVITNVGGKIIFVMMLLLTICYVRKKMKLRYILLTIGTAYLAMSSVRSLFLFFLCGLFPVAYAFKDYFPLRQKSIKRNVINYRLRKILIVLISITIGIILYQNDQELIKVISKMSFIRVLLLMVCIIIPIIYNISIWFKKNKKGTELNSYWVHSIFNVILGIAVAAVIIINDANCKQFQSESSLKPAVDYLLEKNQKENVVLWTGYNTGPYPEFRGIACYLDTRAEVFLKNNNGEKDILFEYINLQKGELHYKDFISRYNFTHFLTNKKDILYTYLCKDPDYRLIYEDKNFRLFEKVI